MVQVAVCQMDVSRGDLTVNHSKVVEMLQFAAEERAKLVVFPELSLSGYVFDSLAEARQCALTEESTLLMSIAEHCQNLQLIAIVGFIEGFDGEFYNTAGVFGVQGGFARYRKIHLPMMGVDRFLSSGNLGFPTFDAPWGQFGVNICYDQRFPESARIPAIKGAQIIAVPTNEVMASHDISNLLIRARAYENRVFYLWANRVGTEDGMRFTGASQIVDPLGEIVRLASNDDEEILFADLDLSLAEDKGIIVEAGEYEMDIMKDRAPEYYGELVEPHLRDLSD